MSVVKTYQPGEDKVIRGPLVAVSLLLYHGPTLVEAAELEKRFWPAQTNNFTSWLQCAYKQLGSSMRVMLGQSNKLEYVVNDGEGAKKGRGCHTNKLAILLRKDGLVEYRLEITVITEPAAMRQARLIKEGHTPRKLPDWSKLTYLDPKKKIVIQWVDEEDGEGYSLTWPMDEFYAEHPEWKGKLPAKGFDNPDDVRTGKWAPRISNG